jgi:hypothetical protein
MKVFQAATMRATETGILLEHFDLIFQNDRPFRVVKWGIREDQAESPLVLEELDPALLVRVAESSPQYVYKKGFSQ